MVKAEARARQLNAVIGQAIIEAETRKILAREDSIDISVGAWIDSYHALQAEYVAGGQIKQSTADHRRYMLTPVKKRFGKRKLVDLDTRSISALMKEYVKQNKTRTANSIRTVLIDLFAEAIGAGHFPADKPNPADVAKAPRNKVKRARLMMPVFLEALAWAKEHQQPYLWRSYLLALLTGQRLDDVGKARFKDVQKIDGVEYLGFVQTKTGTKVLVPLDLGLPSIGLTVRDVISMCRDGVVSPYLFHHCRSAGMAKPGSKIRVKTLSNGFAEAIRAVRPAHTWGDYDPPPFHELRSLAEREYKTLGVDTQKLLGHKHQSMTETYADVRGHDWIVVPLTASN
nr:tyrosine-type recombinase/integrase [Marinobacterium litorale]